jgi:hypothetical protein
MTGGGEMTTSIHDQVVRMRCGRWHSGSHELARGPRGAWECQGCGEWYTDREVEEAAGVDEHGEIVVGGQGWEWRR